ncbi:other/FunK1 protein kinase [Coprinopsis cinerea okayama7|uniref:Other/FunK1 protein kinase n=1 Tax=Coprinopsis cinerea (strain Okayama-7 / 130 / ATCC MYA-4618 / FGSC 9003) TaxID=240176 RepID=A8P9C4_COPC7|nr:other/FunK1 protein kinase [Coprinopsis cinerea okayama7\|eukprot:XP_001839740.1 other/FunK1 protein kinase [Coprinopsis cinerea okayama7\
MSPKEKTPDLIRDHETGATDVASSPTGANKERMFKTPGYDAQDPPPKDFSCPPSPTKPSTNIPFPSHHGHLENVEEWLKKCHFFNDAENRWEIGHLLDPKDPSALSFALALTELIVESWSQDEEGHSRNVCVPTPDDYNKTRKYPDIYIVGDIEYDTFLRPGTPELVAIAVSENIKNVTRHIESLQSYAQQMFKRQPNRNFALVLHMNEEHARLYLFDRMGHEYTDLIDIHAQAAEFVSVVIRLVSFDAATLGFDPSITWTLDDLISQHTQQGYIHTVNAKGQPRSLHIGPCPKFIDPTLAGRGTVIWDVVDHVGSPLIVKEAWRLVRDVNRDTPEYEILKKAQGIRGVVQMVDCEEVVCKTSDWRKRSTTACMVKYRIIMVKGKETMRYFHRFPPERTLGTLIAVVEGHRDLLLDRGVLHSDISVNNILFGLIEGGLLIDLDYAVNLEPGAYCRKSTEPRGTFPFRSLNNLAGNLGLPQGYTDDLEAIFYILCCLFLRLDGKGYEVIYALDSNNKRVVQRIDKRNDLIVETGANVTDEMMQLMDWEDIQHPDKAYLAKLAFLREDKRTFEQQHRLTSSKYWDLPTRRCWDLIHDLREMFWEINVIKFPSLASKAGRPDKTFKDLHERDQVERYYKRFLGYLQQAIVDIQDSRRQTSGQDRVAIRSPAPRIPTPTDFNRARPMPKLSPHIPPAGTRSLAPSGPVLTRDALSRTRPTEETSPSPHTAVTKRLRDVSDPKEDKARDLSSEKATNHSKSSPQGTKGKKGLRKRGVEYTSPQKTKRRRQANEEG